MSARRRRPVRLTPEARRDYSDILLYTRGSWGARQQTAYRAAFTRAFKRLTTYPHLGPPRDDLFPGCRGLPVEQHLIYYRVQETETVVVRILHQRQDATGAVREP